MRKTYISAIVLATALLASSTTLAQEEFPLLEGPYMGQTPPGMVAEPFAPGVISREGWELEGVFAPGMNEFYFTRRGGQRSRPTVIGFRQQGTVWKKYLEFERDGEIVF